MSRLSNRGKSLQDLLDSVCVQYRRAGIANINPVPVPYKRIGVARANQWVGVYAGKSTVDYVGITRSGHALAFDAKATELKTRVDLAESHFPSHQREFLNWYDQAGHLAFLVVEFKALREIYRIPIRPVLHYLSEGHASLPLTIVRTCGVQLGSGRGVLLDILAGIE